MSIEKKPGYDPNLLIWLHGSHISSDQFTNEQFPEMTRTHQTELVSPLIDERALQNKGYRENGEWTDKGVTILGIRDIVEENQVRLAKEGLIEIESNTWTKKGKNTLLYQQFHEGCNYYNDLQNRLEIQGYKKNGQWTERGIEALSSEDLLDTVGYTREWAQDEGFMDLKGNWNSFSALEFVFRDLEITDKVLMDLGYIEDDDNKSITQKGVEFLGKDYRTQITTTHLVLIDEKALENKGYRENGQWTNDGKEILSIMDKIQIKRSQLEDEGILKDGNWTEKARESSDYKKYCEAYEYYGDVRNRLEEKGYKKNDQWTNRGIQALNTDRLLDTVGYSKKELQEKGIMNTEGGWRSFQDVVSIYHNLGVTDTVLVDLGYIKDGVSKEATEKGLQFLRGNFSVDTKEPESASVRGINNGFSTSRVRKQKKGSKKSFVLKIPLWIASRVGKIFSKSEKMGERSLKLTLGSTGITVLIAILVSIKVLYNVEQAFEFFGLAVASGCKKIKEYIQKQ